LKMEKLLEALNGFSVTCVTMSFFLLFISGAYLAYSKLSIEISSFAQIVWIIIWIIASFRIGFAIQRQSK